MDYSYLKASDGTGPAVLAHIESTRAVSSTVIDVDSVDNWPANFIVTTGTLLGTGFLNPATITEMRGHLNAGNIIIDSYEPGFSDAGNSIGQVAIVKQATGWADKIVELAQVSHNNDGTMKATAIRSALALDPGAVAGWTPGIVAPTTITYNGNNIYTLVFNGTDLRTTLFDNMKLRATRTVTAPIQCTSLNGTNQYFNKTSPAGMTFTDDFVASAWIYLTSYTTGSSTIISRYNGTSGWEFRIEANTGQLGLVGYNAGAANYVRVRSHGAIPLNRWVHVAAQLDMSAFTATTTTCFVMLNGVDWAAQIDRGGTNPAALVQAGDLQVGASNGAANFFPGKLAQPAVYSAKVLQATLTAAGNQTLAGNETSLISAYSFNNVLTDLNTTSANNLTAQGAAVATNADSPFAGGASASAGNTAGTVEFAEILNISLAGGNTTIIAQTPVGFVIPVAGGISALAYSPQGNPIGFKPIETLFVVKVMGDQTPVTAEVAAPALVHTIYVPAGKKVRLRAFNKVISSGVAGIGFLLRIYDGAVSSGRMLDTGQIYVPTAGTGNEIQAEEPGDPVATAGFKTYRVSVQASGAGGTYGASKTVPFLFTAEVC